MVKKLIQHGNSSALIIEKPILELLHITSDTSLDISTDGKSLIITPIDKKLETSLGKINKKHGKTLKRLAE
ncbi:MULTISPECIES: AbrB/MazE/SpoVT family DNA-binding domain-containing protein [Leptospira]|uniref:AbrB/MazE/SpoVT family DNA-binding domain-containing protein n=2 Tax=Leptospira TaxID=171 RepID=A0A6N4QX33_9LEPT|nr:MULTISPECIES: AbrB family transcriptional regulator [Leptospira]PJZ29626.1 AbrB family transcriptional regulator [Leptospira kmetyi]PJZ41712.1 AbrB family transcriptional regulator [Leptospira kmetyi]TGK14801.1 AbrB/MazE/SpoVT family DNA-binding domain-containing protein [Leptospira kmetyi]TGK33586.1 AbrB/MazE/SpoVT family DNA-binding domain-containing protein [Leptospira kmetyi]TGL76011.1 AbrB/MazE/SpoVT family DNA-binding domain-containing protein [Leptospira yasudae]